MSRLRLLLLVAGAGTLLAGLPSHAGVRTGSDVHPTVAGETDSPAMQLLAAASRAARSRSYSGTQYVSTWRDDVATSSVADIRHTPGSGSVVDVRPTAGSAPDVAVTPATDLDPRLLPLLDRHYVLSVASDASCAGRAAHVIEARRTDGGIAGRFWLDADSGLVLRREAFDRSGRLVRSSAFASLTVGPESAEVASSSLPVEQLDRRQVDSLRRDGWQVPLTLARDLQLYDARLRTHDGQDVLHLSYSDGLSTLSLFAQRGRLGTRRMAGFTRETVGKSAVWVHPASPERVVWGGGGRVFTLLSDAPAETVRAVVTVLPHEKVHRGGLLARLGRGLSRLASWLNPFS